MSEEREVISLNSGAYATITEGGHVVAISREQHGETQTITLSLEDVATLCFALNSTAGGRRRWWNSVSDHRANFGGAQ